MNLNPSIPIDQDRYENPGGRPPERVGQVDVPLVLERPASPVVLEDQRIAKKGKSGEGDGDGGSANTRVKDMDADCPEGMSVDGNTDERVDIPGRHAGDGDKQPLSYASVTAKGSTPEGIRQDDSLLDPDAVEVLDEDCVIDNSGAFPTIAFSERVHSQVDQTVEAQSPTNVVTSGCPLNANTKAADLHAPWMMASTRRRRAVAPVMKRREDLRDRGEGSRFTVLQNIDPVDADVSLVDQEAMMEDDSEQCLELSDGPQGNMVSNVHALSSPVPGTVAYIESNPARKSRKNVAGNKVGSSVTVIPLGAGSRSEVVEYVHSRNSGNHTAVSINDMSFNDRGASRSKGCVGGVRMGRIGKENAVKGLRINKSVEFRPPRRSVLAEWIPSASTTGNNVGTQLHKDLGRDHDPGDPRMSVSDANVVVVNDLAGVVSSLDRGVEPLQ
ncbi:hypothetical protein V6N11_055863 [Hibiscus sabdariffa]|uniref:Uncharacterized protein n=1 Tax=Hibiscus sabdariffa TaxID=183260 RepID=A0ABR2T2Y3_9ROSI